MQFDSYCHAIKKHFFAKAILLLTNEPTLVREKWLCYFTKNIPFASFLIILYSKSIFIMPPKTPTAFKFHPEYNLCATF